MKCIYDKHHDTAVRVSDEYAAKVVKSDPKRYSYTTKRRWKSEGRKYLG